MQAKRKTRKSSAQEEQLRLLRQILAELQKLNVSLAAGRQAAMEPGVSSDIDSSDEELDEYE